MALYMIQKFSSQELLAHTKRLASEERRVTTALVESLAEIDRRRLFAELGYGSLWEFATRELGLSESAAHRRIQAARLLRDVPEVKAKLEEGKLSLSNAAMVQSFRRAEKKLGHEQDAGLLVKAVEDLSQKECEAKLFEISPQAVPKEKDRIVSAQKERELKFVVSEELFEKLQRIKGLIAHAKPEASYAELLEYLADEQLARLEKQKGINLDPVSTRTAAAKVTEGKPLPAGKRVYIPQALQKAVWARSRGQCEFENGESRCSSRYRLQIDHRIMLAEGGANEISNLRLLCRNHNLQQSENRLGRVLVKIASPGS